MTPIPDQAHRDNPGRSPRGGKARAPGMAALLVAGLGAALLLGAGPAMAKGGPEVGERCGAGADTRWQSIAALSEKLEAEGYTDFLRVQRSRGCYDVIARKADERPLRLWLNPASLEVTGFSRIMRPRAGAGPRHHAHAHAQPMGGHRMKGAWSRKGEPGMQRDRRAGRGGEPTDGQSQE